MAYALVGSMGAVTNNSANVANTPAWGQTPTANNLGILWVTGGSTTTAVVAPTPTGWTLAVQIAAAASSSSIFYKILAGSDTAPTNPATASTAWSSRLGEFSGNPLSGVVDKSGTNTGTTSPLVATASGVDVLAGELVCVCSQAAVSTAAISTLTNALNNGTLVSSNNGGTSATNHYVMSYLLSTTSKAAADANTFTYTTTNVTGASTVVASFVLPGIVVPRRTLMGVGT